jgi:hypothetical protein
LRSESIPRRPAADRRLLLGALGLTVACMLGGTAPVSGAELSIGEPIPVKSAVLAGSGRVVELDQLLGDAGELVVFTSPDCPAALEWRAELDRLSRVYRAESVSTLIVLSGPPTDGRDIDFPYVLDEDGELARSFGVTRLPEVFLFDGGGRLVYRGAVGLPAGDGRSVALPYLADALAALIARDSVPTPVTSAEGCPLP